MVKVWNERLKDILIRAFKTFIQGFLAALIVLLKDTDLEDFSMLKTILIGALALEPPEDTEASGDSYE